MVYNGTYSGMDTSLWDPHSAIPMVRSTLYAIEKGNFMAYQDIGDMLFNFLLIVEVIKKIGLDVMNVRKY